MNIRVTLGSAAEKASGRRQMGRMFARRRRNGRKGAVGGNLNEGARIKTEMLASLQDATGQGPWVPVVSSLRSSTTVQAGIPSGFGQVSGYIVPPGGCSELCGKRGPHPIKGKGSAGQRRWRWFFRPYGTCLRRVPTNPAIDRWAMFFRPVGRGRIRAHPARIASPFHP